MAEYYIRSKSTVISPQNEIIVHGFPTDVFVDQHNATAISSETGVMAE